MVKVIIRLKGQKKNIIQNHPTISSAKKFRKFVGKEGSVKIYSRGKLLK